MSKPSRYFNTLLITLLIPLVPFCLYYFFYFSSQKTYFTNRDFRLLTVLTRQIEAKVDGTAGAYQKAAGAASAAYHPEKSEEFEFESFLEPIKKDGTNIRPVNAPERLSAFPKERMANPASLSM